jgi:hypothetical protein
MKHDVMKYGGKWQHRRRSDGKKISGEISSAGGMAGEGGENGHGESQLMKNSDVWPEKIENNRNSSRKVAWQWHGGGRTCCVYLKKNVEENSAVAAMWRNMATGEPKISVSAAAGSQRRGAGENELAKEKPASACGVAAGDVGESIWQKQSLKAKNDMASENERKLKYRASATAAKMKMAAIMAA